ncbi:MAG TPA: class I SAM-dependent methyltransferase [Candidatus Dormibacteraeota bacterium]|nr:class I SAM-dependent methyltransferase [Candidatus Dormibacteraeota bacterium]
MHDDVERFSEWAPSYDRHHLQRRVFEPVQRIVLELAAKEVPQPEAILDIGCGTGRLLRIAEQRFAGARLEGVDAAEGMIKQAQASAPSGSKVGFQLGTAEHLPFSDGEFDLVFSTMTFHHWADQSQGIAEIARVMNPQGRWLLADFIATGPMRVVFALVRPRRFHERGRIDSLLAPARLRVAAERRVPGLWGQVSALAIGHR